jgi:hypothetical protein
MQNTISQSPEYAKWRGLKTAPAPAAKQGSDALAEMADDKPF